MSDERFHSVLALDCRIWLMSSLKAKYDQAAVVFSAVAGVAMGRQIRLYVQVA